MNDQSIIAAPKVSITVGGKALEQIKDDDLVQQTFRDSADHLTLRADAIEAIPNPRIYEMAIAVLSDSTKFIKEREDSCDREIQPYKSAMKRIVAATETLLSPLRNAKLRLQPLINEFARKEKDKADGERRKQAAEVQRLQREAAQLERKKKDLEAEQARAQLRVDQQQPFPTPQAQQELVQTQQALELQQATLNQQIAEATKVIEAPKVEGSAVQTKWTFKTIGENEHQWRASWELAFKSHPDWFDLKPRVRVIEKAIKDADGKLTCPGLVFQLETKVRST